MSLEDDLLEQRVRRVGESCSNGFRDYPIGSSPQRWENDKLILPRRLKEIAAATKVANATLHKFRHTYATRLLESGCDIVTVQRLMGHSDLDTTRQYLDPPDEKLKRCAVSKLSMSKTTHRD